MADDGNHRYRTNDPYARGAPGAGGYPHPGRAPVQGHAPGGQHPGADPLAELARLIGQNDPYSDYGHDNSRAAAQRDPRRAANGPAQDWRSAPAPDAYRDPLDPRTGGNGAYPQHDPYRDDTAQYSQPATEQHFDERPYGGNGYADPAYGREYGYQQHGEDAYGQAPASGRPYDSRYYQDDPRMPPQGEEMYDDAAPVRRRGGMMTVLAVLGLAVVGTAAAFGYRAVFSTSSNSSAPPVIRADGTPKKIVSTSESRDPQSGKLIYDRVGERVQGEKVVARQEEPVDVKTPRVVFPGPAANPAAGSIPSSASALAPVAAGATGEPKRIRTVTIRSDQSATAAAAPAARSTAPAPRASAPETQPAPAPRVASARPEAVPQVQDPAQSSGPLSLTPPAATRAVPPPSRATSQPLRTASAPAATDAVPAGNYTVQVSSQRSEADAQSAFRTMQTKFPNILGGRQPIIRRADLGDKGIYFRAQVGPFTTVDQASELCNSLKAAGGQCIIQRN
ncbi:MAG: SPOR domain-containing protein [Rhizobiales bacterium]|nr:SPOR domain-containing protein [Hyphomicrobiales bacterium]